MTLKLSIDDAVFLDFDGTLVDIAIVPDAIVVPDELSELLNRANACFESAVCIVSGRSLNDLRRYISASIDFSGEHGAQFDLSGQKITNVGPWPTYWESTLSDAENRFPGLAVERKKCSVALHYRLNPLLEPALVAVAKMLCCTGGARHAFAVSNYTIEIKEKNIDKGKAIEFLMTRDNYRNKRPVFIADDTMDGPGFDKVEQMGGLAIHVGEHFGGEPSQVRKWLGEQLEALG